MDPRPQKRKPIQKSQLKSNSFPRFITFEGGEGAGKTTLIQRLKAFLQGQGYEVLLTREPGGSALGEILRNLLLHSKESLQISPRAELLLFLAARAEHVEEIIRPALQKGKIVLCDRYNDSTIAYQGIARKLGMQKVTALCRYATNQLDPDVTIYLDIPPEIGLKRALKADKIDTVAGQPDRMESLKIDFHRLVRKAFLKIAKKEPERVHVLDASQSRDEVFEKLLSLIANFKR